MSVRLPVILQQKNTPSRELLGLFRAKSEDFLVKQGELSALKRFRKAATTIPAYKNFLKKNGIKPERVRTIKDFQLVPETNKKNYIERYDIAERSPNGSFDSHRIIAVSSGTTGTPTLWPRGILQEEEAFMVHEALFVDIYELKKYKTLAVIGFPMGVYVSGMATTIPTFLASVRHPNLSILTAGNNKENILSMLPKLQRYYDQIILFGHPFFVKDIVETGKRQGISWGKTKLRTFFCSEGFNEEWRSYLGSMVPKSRPERDFLATYGSSELLLMGYETPETILIRRMADSKPSFRDKLFRGALVPNLFQYNPVLRYIEENKKGELLFTAESGISLIRFNMYDSGSLIPREKLHQAMKTEKISFRKELEKLNWKPWHLPYVALYGRSDHTLVFYAVNIYPEHIHNALNHKPFLKIITGKFRMEKVYHKNHEQKFVIHVELQNGIRPSRSLRNTIGKRILTSLLLTSIEYADASARLEADLKPYVILHKNGDLIYFKPGLKPSYIIT